MENHFLCYPHTSNHTVHKNGFLEKLLVKTAKDKYLISNFKMKQEQKKLTPHKIVGTNRPSDESTPTNFPKKISHEEVNVQRVQENVLYMQCMWLLFCL